MGTIDVDFFPEEVDSPDHPEAIVLRTLLEQVADDFDCELLSFHVDRGTVSFSFDSDELTADILKILQEKLSNEPE